MCAALVEDGITVFAKYNPSPRRIQGTEDQGAGDKPDLIIDDGGDFATLLHSERPDLMENVRGGAEETTTASCG